MADLSAANFSTTDSSNNAAAPNGWKPGTMLPSDVEPTMQATTGAIKRFWERANAQITTTGAAGSYVYTPTNLAYPSSIVQGEVFGFVAHQASAGNDTFTIAGSTTLGPYNLYVVTTSGIRQIKANEIVQNQICAVQYSSAVGGMLVYAAASLSSFSPAFTGTPTAPTAPAGTNTTQLATTGFATQLAFQAALPAQAGATAGSAVLTDGAGNATWGDPMITAAAGGTSDAITATFTPAITLRDKQKCFVVCSAANTTTTPTFAPNGLTAHTITMAGGQPLAVGSIAGAGFVALLEYNLANLRWELMNPAGPAIFPDYANLRIYAGSQQNASISGFLGAAAPSGIAGAFTRDDTDTTSGAVFTASSAPVPSPAAPALSQTAGGAMGVTTYYVKVTYVTAAGETLASAESNFNVGANNLLVVNSPSAQTGATGYNVYVSTSAGTETRQNAATINIGTNWTEPTSGVTAGIGQPAGSTAGSVLTVSAVTNGTLAAYYSVNRADAGNSIGIISALISGTGTTGTYLLNASVTLASMSMTADNGGTIIVASNGKRWKRNFDGPVNLLWFGAHADGTNPAGANDTAMSGALAYLKLIGGGELRAGPGNFRFDAIVTMPVDANTPPRMVPISFRGAGCHWSGQGSPLLGSTVFDLRGGDANGKIKCRGLGVFSSEGITYTNLGTADTYPFIHTTNTTLLLRRNAFLGGKVGTACDQDAIILGGTTQVNDGSDAAPFQGYGTVIEENFFNGVRRLVYGRTYANGVKVQKNTAWTNCGSNLAGGAAIEFDGDAAGTSPGNLCVGNLIADNLIEISNYPYGVKLTHASQNKVLGNEGYDGTATSLAMVRLESTAGSTLVTGTVGPAGKPYLSEATAFGLDTKYFSGGDDYCQLKNLNVPAAGTVNVSGNFTLKPGSSGINGIAPVGTLTSGVLWYLLSGTTDANPDAGGVRFQWRGDGSKTIGGSGAGNVTNNLATGAGYYNNGRGYGFGASGRTSGGNMEIDTGSGGSNFDIKAFALRYYDHTNTLRVTVSLGNGLGWEMNADLTFNTVGKGRRFKTGANGKFGSATLAAGTVTVANTSVTASSKVMLNRSAVGGTPGFASYTVNAGVGFTINSSSGTDTSTFDYEIVETY